MRRKVLGMLLGVAIAAILLIGCSSDDGSENTDKLIIGKVGISMPTHSQERWNRDSAYLTEHFEEVGYETILTFSDNDAKKQVKDIQDMIADGVDLLIVNAIDGTALDEAMEEATEAKVPVISYDRLILNDAVSYYVSFDNYMIGKLQGEFIADNLELKNAAGKVYNMEITSGDTADNNAKYFYNGAMDVLKPYIKAGTLKVVSGQTDFLSTATEQWDLGTAYQRAQNILSSYYTDGTQLDAWLCSSDTVALGVEYAITSGYTGSNTILITGQDGDEANLKNIVDGIQTMTVYKNASDEAVVTLSLAQSILEGREIDASLTKDLEIECRYDTKSYKTSDGKRCSSFLLIPKVITKDNLQDLVDSGLYKRDTDGYLYAVE